MLTDPIADMLTRIRNANKAMHDKAEMPTSRKRESRPKALLHPEDMVSLGVDTGDPVRLGNRRGSVVVHAEPRHGQQRGVVVVESIWPNDAYAERLGLNVLLSSDAAPPNGGAAIHDTKVWIRAA